MDGAELEEEHSFLTDIPPLYFFVSITGISLHPQTVLSTTSPSPLALVRWEAA